MSPAPSESLALQCVKLSDALEIHDGLIFDFYPGLPHIYIYLFFTSCEVNRRIYMSMLHLCHYRMNKRSLVALRANHCGNCLLRPRFSLTSLSRKSRKGRCYFVTDRDLVNGCQMGFKRMKQMASSFHLRQTTTLK